MRFYYPRTEALSSQERSSKAEQVRQVAVYLFNMYVSTAAYTMQPPEHLTLNQLGVLDSFSFGKNSFNYAKASDFYVKNKAEIKRWLTSFFSKDPFPSYNAGDAANDAAELAFIRLLERAPRVHGYPGYHMAQKNAITGQAAEPDKQAVAQWMAQAHADGNNRVITYETNTLSLDDFDNKYARRNAMKRTYRCVNDECEYCGYLFGKRVCQSVSSDSSGKVRLYTISAWPVTGKYLTPSSGQRFKLADGSEAAHWQYHTASLVVTQRNGRYAVQVADSFLGGTQPVSLDEWLRHFRAGSAQFAVMPFFRNKTLEETVKTPQKREGNNVMVGGKRYTPHPIEK